MLNQVFICRKLGLAYTAASLSFCGQMIFRMLLKAFLIVEQSQTSSTAQFLRQVSSTSTTSIAL
jgi:hypothetical protein